MADDVTVRSRRLVPETLRTPLAMIGVFGLLAGGLGLYGLSTIRDQTTSEAVVETEELAARLLDEPARLQGADAEAALAEAVVGARELRAATVRLGPDDLVSVGRDAPRPTDDEVAAAAAASDPVASLRGEAVVVTTAFATLGGEPVVLATRTPVRPLRLGWYEIGLAWLLVAAAIAVTSLLLERGRRDRVMTLEETVQALYAHDAVVTRQQQDLLRSKADFVSGISKELQVPLEVIKGIANRLARGGEVSPAERRDLVDGLRLNADRLDGLVGDLIDVDRLTQRTVPVRRRPVRIAELVDRALEDIDTDGHDVRVDVGDVTANATPGHVERILRALVHNAVTHTPPGGTIEIGAVRDGDAVVLGVDDTGHGIAPADRLIVFEPLRQLGDEPGMGLGLALVKRFAELHGGRAWVEESPSGGAAFRVILPDEGEPVRLDPWRMAGEQAGSQDVVVGMGAP